MADSGWVKMYRETLHNPVIMKSPEHFMIWHILVYTAAYKPRQELFAGKPITLQPGQLTTGRKQLSMNSGINESKITRVLNDFVCAQQIEQQTSSKNRLISIVNWGKYQNSEQQNEQQVNNKRTTSEQRANTLKEIKNIEVKESNARARELSSSREIRSMNDIQPSNESPEERARRIQLLREG